MFETLEYNNKLTLKHDQRPAVHYPLELQQSLHAPSFALTSNRTIFLFIHLLSYDF